MSEMISTRTGLGNGLLELMEKRGDILVASADTYRSFALGPIVTKYADRYFEFGIAEQNMLRRHGFGRIHCILRRLQSVSFHACA